MTPSSERERTLNKLHELTARVQCEPERKLQIIQDFYVEQVHSDLPLADVALAMRQIVEAGGTSAVPNQTEHAKAVSGLYIFSMASSAVVTLGCIISGAFLYKAPNVSTKISLWGGTLDTQSFGVAIIFIGVVCFLLVLRSVHKHISFSKNK